LRTVALTQRSTTVLGGVDVFYTLNAPAINNRGETAWAAMSMNAGQAVWSDVPGASLRAVARQNSQAPGAAAGVTFSDFDGELELGEFGQIAFEALLAGPGVTGSNNDGVWIERTAGDVDLVARRGDVMPGNEPPRQLTFSVVSDMNAAGQLVISGGLSGGLVEGVPPRGAWTDRGGELELLIRTGSEAPGVTNGSHIGTIGGVSVNDGGRMAFDAELTGAVTPRAIWSNKHGNQFNMLARENAPAPDVGSGVNYSALEGYIPSDDGTLVFRASLGGAGVTTQNRWAVFSDRDEGEVHLVARDGDQAPGTPSGVRLSNTYPFGISREGEIGLATTLAGPGITSVNDEALYIDRPGQGLALIFRQGSAAPGMSSGESFGSPSYLQMNGRGQVALVATLAGPAVTPSNDLSLWAQDGTGALRLVVREGDQINVNDGLGPPELRTVADIEFAPEQNAFNDFGEVAFLASFTNFTEGVFVSTVAASPRVAGDFDADGQVDGSDFLLWQRGGGDAGELSSWAGSFGGSTASVSAGVVPEPSGTSMALSLGLGIGVLRCLRR
jgi:hypothetical protein